MCLLEKKGDWSGEWSGHFSDAWQPPKTHESHNCLGKMCAVNPRCSASSLPWAKQGRGGKRCTTTCARQCHPSLARAEEMRRRATWLTVKKPKSTCRERVGGHFSSCLFLFLFIRARFRGPIKSRPKTPSASLPNKREREKPPCKARGRPGWDRFVHPRGPFMVQSSPFFHRYLVPLSPCPPPSTTQRTTPTTAPHTPSRALFIPANPPAPCRSGGPSA